MLGQKQTPKKKKAGPGRPRGVPNKSTASVKAALQAAFDERGGVPALLDWADGEPTEFYKLWAKMLPTEVTGKDGAAFSITVKYEDPAPDAS